jgi:alpha-L-fucosidase
VRRRRGLIRSLPLLLVVACNSGAVRRPPGPAGGGQGGADAGGGAAGSATGGAGGAVRADAATPPADPIDAGADGPRVADVAPVATDRLAWWREAKFGMFVHWGLYAALAGTWKGVDYPGIGEWIMNDARIPVGEYAAVAARFNPVKFDAGEWVRIAKDAGMKYIVITAKHHDGFAMFPSKASSFNLTDASPFKRDPLRELAEACKREGLRLGFYYSQAQDWHHPGGALAVASWDPAQAGDMDQYLRTVAVPQVQELLTNYGDVAVLWWDTPFAMSRARAEPLAALLAAQPGIITNDRLGGGFDGDYWTPEQFIPGPTLARPWETCMTMNDTWGWKATDNNWKSPQALVRNLVSAVSKGGNYLLNVGPTAEGLIPDASVQRLAEMGRWLRANGEAVYGVSPSPFRALPWGHATSKPGRLYLHVFDWPAGGSLVVPMQDAPLRARLLADPTAPLTAAQTPEGAVIRLPAAAPDPLGTVVVVEIAAARPTPLPLRQADDGTVRLGAADAEIVGSTAQLEGNSVPNIGYWSNDTDFLQWSVEVTKAGRFAVSISYSCEPGSEGASVTVSAGGKMVTVQTQSTGGWGSYVTAPAGQVTLDQPGKILFQLRGMKRPGGVAVMNFREVTLQLQ